MVNSFHSGPAWFPLIALAIPILLFGVLLATVITLLMFPATRKASAVLLALFLGVPLALFLAFSWYRLAANDMIPQPVPQPITFQDMPAPAGRPITLPPGYTPEAPIPLPPGYTPQPAPAKIQSETPKDLTEEEQPLEKKLTAESARLIDTLGKVLAKTIIENPKAWQELMAKATRQMAQPAEKEEPKAEVQAEKTPSEPLTPAAPPPKPAWVDRPFRQEGNDYLVDAVGDPYETAWECEAALPEVVRKQAIGSYLKIFMPEAIGKVCLSPETLKNFVVDRWVETRNIRLGEMQILHANVRLDPGSQNSIKEAYQQAVISGRLQWFGTKFAAGFLLLGTVWGYLKIDLTTGGNHRGILRAAVAIVILSIAAAIALVV
jgi:hypothetical protein